MDNSFQIHNQTFEIEYYPATVIQSDKYEERSPFSNNYWAYTPKHDIAFRVKDTDREFFFTTQYSRIRVYIGQEVALITLDKKIIGFLSTTSNDYYFLTNKFARILGFGIDWKWILLIEVLIGMSLFFVKEYSQQQYIVIALFTIPVMYWIGMRFYNLYLERQIDKAIQEG
jgi:hypothetical protein